MRMRDVCCTLSFSLAYNCIHRVVVVTTHHAPTINKQESLVLRWMYNFYNSSSMRMSNYFIGYADKPISDILALKD